MRGHPRRSLDPSPRSDRAAGSVPLFPVGVARKLEEDLVQRRLDDRCPSDVYSGLGRGDDRFRNDGLPIGASHTVGVAVPGYRDHARQRLQQRRGVGGTRGHREFECISSQAVLQFLRGPDRHDLPVVDDGDPIAELVGLIEVMRRHEDGESLALP